MNLLNTPEPITHHQYSKDTKPVVSIACLAYNQENYIRDALEGFLMQKTTFPVEILIHDDASTDKSADVIRKYASKYPYLIKPIYQTENQYSQGNKPGKINRERGRGKYTALCEGDDYWTDPFKLQKQVEFLEANNEYSMVCTNFSIVDEKKNLISKWGWQGQKIKPYIDQETILGSYTPKTLTVLLRNSCIKKIDPGRSGYHFPNGDVAFFAAITEFGPCRFFNEITGCYRETNTGIWAGIELSHRLKMKTKTLENLLKFYSDDKKLYRPIYKRLINFYRVRSIISFKKAELLNSGTCLFYYIYYKVKLLFIN